MQDQTDDSDVDADEVLQQIKNDRAKGLRAERTIGEADQLDDPRTVVRYLAEGTFQVAFTRTTGFPLGMAKVSEQPGTHVRDWISKNDVEVIDVADEELFETTDYDDGQEVSA